MQLNLSAIQHVGIPVTNLAKSTAFYKSLGFETAMESVFPHNGEEGNAVMMKSGEIVMELYLMPETDLQEIRNRQDGHIDHIAFNVTGINEVFQQLKNENFKVLEKAPVYLPFWSNGCKYFNIEGPDGERLEFNEIL